LSFGLHCDEGEHCHDGKLLGDIREFHLFSSRLVTLGVKSFRKIQPTPSGYQRFTVAEFQHYRAISGDFLPDIATIRDERK
jgi:hypothetical protein